MYTYSKSEPPVLSLLAPPLLPFYPLGKRNRAGHIFTSRLPEQHGLPMHLSSETGPPNQCYSWLTAYDANELSRPHDVAIEGFCQLVFRSEFFIIRFT